MLEVVFHTSVVRFLTTMLILSAGTFILTAFAVWLMNSSDRKEGD